MSEQNPRRELLLTQACWPAFDFVINFTRQIYHETPPTDYDELLRDALSAVRNGNQIARQDPNVERAWDEKTRAMIIYFIDNKLATTDWPGAEFWVNNMLETHMDGLDEVEPLGGENFFRDCDELLKEYQQAKRMDRVDRDLIAEQLSLYFTCIQLGFKGELDDQPTQLKEYAQRIFDVLPHAREDRKHQLFPQAYEHTIERDAIYRLGLPTMLVATVFLGLLIAVGVTYNILWRQMTREIRQSAEHFRALPSKAGSATSAPADAQAAIFQPSTLRKQDPLL